MPGSSPPPTSPAHNANRRCSVLITAGPTHEPIDAVRYLANRSSGRLGIALAEAAAVRGMRTTLLLGPTHLTPREHASLTVRRFRTTADLQAELADHAAGHDVIIMAAAVADYRPKPGREQSKLRRKTGGLTLELESTPDLLAELTVRRREGQLMIGFALEPADRLLNSARDKLHRKGVDAIVANELATMNSEDITATLVLPGDRTIEAPSGASKAAFAAWLLDRIEDTLMPGLAQPPISRVHE